MNNTQENKDWREEFDTRYIRGDFGDLELRDIQGFLLRIEQQAYKRAGEVARKSMFVSELANTEMGKNINLHGKNIAKEIEQLASNK